MKRLLTEFKTESNQLIKINQCGNAATINIGPDVEILADFDYTKVGFADEINSVRISMENKRNETSININLKNEAAVNRFILTFEQFKKNYEQ